MTREEAIKELNDYYDTTDEVWLDFPKLKEALEMAISALSADGEYIKKEDAIEYLNDLFGGMCHVSFNDVLQSIDSLPTTPIHKRAFREFPSADVRENMHGKWISELELYGEGKCNYQCSVCGRSIRLEQNETLDDYPFCHCGADMRGET